MWVAAPDREPSGYPIVGEPVPRIAFQLVT